MVQKDIFLSDKRIVLFIGNLGSGKTELAINYSLSLQKKGYSTAIVDVDVVNPYFRTRLVKKELEELGLNVISSEGNLVNADLPALSPRIKSVFENSSLKGVFDVGGDSVGATVLGRFKELLPKDSYELFFVVNTCRPFTKDVEGILKMFLEIKNVCGMEISALVNNTNLGSKDTSLEDILKGEEILKEVSGKVNLPIAFTGIAENLLKDYRKIRPEKIVLPLKFFMKPPF